MKAPLAFVLLWAISVTGLGGQNLDWVSSFQAVDGLGLVANISQQKIAIDQAGNVYAAGSFQGKIDFDPGPDTLFLLP